MNLTCKVERTSRYQDCEDGLYAECEENLWFEQILASFFFFFFSFLFFLMESYPDSSNIWISRTDIIAEHHLKNTWEQDMEKGSPLQSGNSKV